MDLNRRARHRNTIRRIALCYALQWGVEIDVKSVIELMQRGLLEGLSVPNADLKVAYARRAGFCRPDPIDFFVIDFQKKR
jgi:hypothetical protein